MKTIWKFPLRGHETTQEIPKGAKLLTMQLQRGTPTLWFEIEQDAITIQRTFKCLATGEEFDLPGAEYIGTFQGDEGWLAWHVYEVPSTRRAL